MLLLALAACSDTALLARKPDMDIGAPDIEVEPASLHLGPVPEGCGVTRELTISNVGNGPLDVPRTWLDGGGPLLVDDVEVSLPPGASTTMRVVFAPLFDWSGEADVVVESDDPVDPIVRVPVFAEAWDGAPRIDVWYHDPEPIDILWVVDNSDSLWEERARLTDDINAFFGWFLPFETDFHVGVVTTDVDNPDASGRLQGDPTYLTNETHDVAAAFADAVNVGTDEWGNEQGLRAMELALSEPLTSGHNAGFLREEARLAVVFVSDEPDQSGYNARRYVEFLTELKGDPSRVMAAAVVGDRVLGCESTCDGDPQTARAGDTYHEVVEAFGGVTQSICTCEIEPFLQELGLEATAYLRTFPLSETPRSALTVEVFLDGEPSTEPWSYDALQNAVVFDEPLAPGRVVQASYEVPMVCEEDGAVEGG